MAMAWPLAFFLSLQSQSASPLQPIFLPRRHPLARPAVALPLSSPPKNSSTTFSSTSRRLLKSDSNSSHLRARMYYTTRLWIGTPPQKFALIGDTGSTVTYVPCYTCENCGAHQDPKFQPEMSGTDQPEKCNLDCNCDLNKDQCIYERQYAEMSVTSGVLPEDVISFGNPSELSPQRIVFGCETEETGDLYRQHRQHADCIIGLGRGDLNIVDQLVYKGVISYSFLLYYGGMDVGGVAMVLGGISAPSDMVFSYSDPTRSPYYNIQLKEIHVAGKKLALNPSIFDGKFGTVLDSDYEELNSLKQIRGPAASYNDTCFSGASSQVFCPVLVQYVTRVFIFHLPFIVLMKHSKVEGAYCVGIFHNGVDPTPYWENSSPSPSSSSGKDYSTFKMPPTSSPDGAPYYALPGEIEIGAISLDMALSVSYTYLRPRLVELLEFTAKVHLLDFSSEGNSSLVKWGIVPSRSATYISNVTALNMISWVAEHRVTIPEAFGNYQLVQWEVKPSLTQKQRFVPYQSVDGTAQENELQPLQS
ncbi:RING/U-box superfamily protein with ARM repeat domain isoform 1 [Hibiscus syriacus]|uniref:RING/U-box superfamily protein with ARM repeat domain isoform 1 n=1 Tax=Hibiscus syriacus TaxID=106335 RepID=A0A6A2ZU09_HIBSY|nr:RING/U-box superfamily protein with ARM repeat domain isoform 1 [Hibiscus syriacus]